ncbi:MAG: 4-(cytidine 5'-diphospho)-2-C-methyl-D-erythritol kinase [Firmicutes bacterium]|nr:4-(cytidine 5'-diphospho)-2-C-methyl-D-erythritol kinase [Bacillota bacterium]
MALTVLARAKVNLCLDVFGVRPDGYHEIATVLQSVALSDVLTFNSQPEGITLQVAGVPVVTGEENLVLRAARCLAAETGCRRGAAIALRKYIPVAAGLGGGSADAAATLVGLNRIWGLELDEESLCRIAATLGADVPFCVIGGTGLATGRGEELTLLPPLPELGVLLLKPAYGVSTAAVYRAFDIFRCSWQPVAREMAAALMRGEWREALRKCANALECVTFRDHPELPLLKRDLELSGALCALMSGSGPTVFGFFETVQDAAGAGKLLEDGTANVIVTSTASEGVMIQQE